MKVNSDHDCQSMIFSKEIKFGSVLNTKILYDFRRLRHMDYLSYFVVYTLNLDSLFFYIKEQRERCSKHSSFVVHSRKSYRFGTKCINNATFL